MVVKSCKHCGEPFEARGRALYCSPECRAIVLYQQRKEAKVRFLDKNPDYDYYKSYYRANLSKFKDYNERRDKDAWNAYAKEARRTGLWKLSSSNHDPRQGHVEWAVAVKELAGFQCERCGSFHDLEAHHIEAYANGLNQLDVDNGICLCHECHRGSDSVHRLYGRSPSHSETMNWFWG